MKIAVLVFAIVANVLMTSALGAVYLGIQTGHIILNFSPSPTILPERMPQYQITPPPTQIPGIY